MPLVPLMIDSSVLYLRTARQYKLIIQTRNGFNMNRVCWVGLHFCSSGEDVVVHGLGLRISGMTESYWAGDPTVTGFTDDAVI